MDETAHDEGLQTFFAVRPRRFGIACRMRSGLVGAAGKAMACCERVAKSFALVKHCCRGVTLSIVEANRQSCALLTCDGTPVSLITVDTSEEGIDRNLWALRPRQLKCVAPAWA